MTTNLYPLPQSNPKLTFLAWAVVVLISIVPDIIFFELTGTVPSWLVFVKIGLLTGLSAAAVVFHPIRPLRNFFLIMVAFFSLPLLLKNINFNFPFLQSIFGSTVFDSRMQAEQTGKLIISLLMIGAMFILGYKRKQFFLTRGDLHAPIDPVPLLGFPKRDPWPVFGLQWGFYIAAALGIMLYLGIRPNSDVFVKVLTILPSIFFYAALNAFNEEITYRVPILATLEPVCGSRQALWMAASFFGIAHYFGTPGGILGAFASVFMGWILSKAMLETRGLFWSWWIHFLSDIAIFTFMTVSLLK